MTEDHWRTLLSATRGGDPEAEAQLLLGLRCWAIGKIRERASARLLRKEDPEDLAQEVLARVSAHLEEFEDRGDGSFLAWAGVILDHVLKDARDHWEAKKRCLDREERFPSRPSRMGLAGPPGRRLPTSPSQHAVRKDTLLRLQESRAQLCPEDQQVLDLRDQDLPWSQVGSLLGISEEAARKRWARARGRLVKAFLRLSHGRQSDPTGEGTPRGDPG